jgi:glycosyltransferase involved in cell wall biosynthesis
MSDRILVFIPCYNCAPQIGRVLAQFSSEIGKRFEEILILDNGSKDRTLEAAVAAAVRTHVKKVTIGRNRENYNLGGSHKAAFTYAMAGDFSHIVVLHGDDQGDIRDLLPVLEQGLHRKYDACLGSRFMSKSKLIGYSAFRIFGNHVFNLLFSIGSGSKVVDLGSGLNILARPVFTDPAVLRFSDDLRFNIYLLLSAIDQKRKLDFFPISWREDDQISNVKMTSQALKTLGILWDYMFRRERFRSNDYRADFHSRYEFEVIANVSGGNSVKA